MEKETECWVEGPLRREWNGNFQGDDWRKAGERNTLGREKVAR